MVGEQEFVADLVPVDFVVNTLIAAGWHIATGPRSVVVYDCASGEMNPLHWYSYSRMTNRAAITTPSLNVQWYPHFEFRSSRIVNLAFDLFCHFPLAFLLDVIRTALGQKPIMMKLARKMRTMTKLAEFCVTRDWVLHTDNLRNMLEDLSASGDRDVFDFDMCSINWECYLKTYLAGIMRYAGKDTPDAIEAARRKVKRSVDLISLWRSGVDRRAKILQTWRGLLHLGAKHPC